MVLPFYVPPSSPPTVNLLPNKTTTQTKATDTKTTTLNPKEPAGT